MTQSPEGLEPGVMSDLPQARIDGREPGADEVFVGQVGYELEGPLAGFSNPIDQVLDRGCFRDVSSHA